ncbi:hypothetical protein N7488_003520 [Penicillium malachiteum]|nr:hypothetical protein N7488_003520 [Penicillium malachiteum]
MAATGLQDIAYIRRARWLCILGGGADRPVEDGGLGAPKQCLSLPLRVHGDHAWNWRMGP